MVANGHHWNPKYPEYPGEFTGTFMHSHGFKRISEEWRGKSVLGIGGGKSGCDVAGETARLAGKVCPSRCSPQWIIPKFLFGIPPDSLSARTKRMPTTFKKFP